MAQRKRERAVLLGAGEAGEVDEQGHPVRGALPGEGEKEGDPHRQADHPGVVPVELLHATEAAVAGDELHQSPFGGATDPL